LANDTISSLEFTGLAGGETFRRYTVRAGELLLGDRGYAHRAGVAHVLDSDGHALVRMSWQNYPVEDADGHMIDILALVRPLGVQEIGDFDVWFSSGGRRYKVRLLAQRLTAEPTADRVRQAKRNAEKRGGRVDPRTLEASCFVLLLTDLSREELPADQAFELYRLRWRVELVFKRLKSLINLDHLRAHDPRLVTTYVMAKLLGALLLEGMCGQVVRALSPPQGEGEATGGDLADVEPVGGDQGVLASAAGVPVPAADHGGHGGADLRELPQPA
jgi:hypothetical protein